MVSKKTQGILLQILIWGIFLLIPILNLPTTKLILNQNAILIKNQLVLGILSITFYYFNYHVAIPRFYLRKRYWEYAGIMILSMFLIMASLFLFRKATGRIEIIAPRERIMVLSNFFLRFLVLFMASFGISFYNRYQQAETQKVKAELKALKHQINPHFLFNILNDLYAQAITKSEGLPENIAKLSSIMRYVLSDAKIEKVPLEKDIEYLKSYIELQERRLTAKTRLSFEVTGDLEGKTIPPLLLINFIENAFKHGVSTEQESHITIRILVEAEWLKMEVSNDIPHWKPAEQPSGKIGLANTRKRLDLLYPGHYTLEILDQQVSYQVKLEMKLT